MDYDVHNNSFVHSFAQLSYLVDFWERKKMTFPVAFMQQILLVLYDFTPGKSSALISEDILGKTNYDKTVHCSAYDIKNSLFFKHRGHHFQSH